MNPYVCNGCKKKFYNWDDFANHEEVLVWVDRLAGYHLCPSCDFMTTTIKKLKYHRVIHKRGKYFACAHCEYITKCRKWFKDHLNVHWGLKPYTCTRCQSQYSSSAMLKAHTRRAHKPRQQAMQYVWPKVLTDNGYMFKCPECGFLSKRCNGISCHYMTHTGEKLYACTMCTYKTKKCTNLKVHMRTHKKGSDGNNLANRPKIDRKLYRTL